MPFGEEKSILWNLLYVTKFNIYSKKKKKIKYFTTDYKKTSVPLDNIKYQRN